MIQRIEYNIIQRRLKYSLIGMKEFKMNLLNSNLTCLELELENSKEQGMEYMRESNLVRGDSRQTKLQGLSLRR